MRPALHRVLVPQGKESAGCNGGGSVLQSLYEMRRNAATSQRDNRNVERLRNAFDLPQIHTLAGTIAIYGGQENLPSAKPLTFHGPIHGTPARSLRSTLSHYHGSLRL